MEDTAKCFGKMLGSTYAKRNCSDCHLGDQCADATAKAASERANRKPLDPKWIDTLIDFVIGPELVIIGTHSRQASTEMVLIMHKMVNALYGQSTHSTTNEWVNEVVVSVRRAYMLYVTARLIKLMDDGMPDPQRIVVPGSDRRH